MATSTHPSASSFDDAYNHRRQRLEQELRHLTQSDPSFAPHAASAFLVVEELGRGGMGVVQRVRDRRLDREAALKVLLPEASDDDGILRFRREAWVMAHLEHPSIPAIFESGRNAEGQLYILMQLLSGETLERCLQELHNRSAAPEDCRELLPFLLKASEAMAYAHARGILHRDLKPSNLILGDYGELTVVDWGLAQALKPIPGAPSSLRHRLRKVPDLASLTQEGSVLGTPGYLSPEQARGEELDERSDVYALGVILTRILTGRLPVEGRSPLARTIATMNGEIRTPDQLRGGLPKELVFIAAEALAADRDRRTPGAEFFARQLRAYLLGRPVPGYPYSRRERIGRWARRRGVLIAWLVFFLAASAFGAVLWAVSLNLEKTRSRIESEGKVAARRLERRNQAALLFSRAQARFGELDAAGAVADLQAAMGLDKDNAELRYDGARLVALVGRFDQARAFLDRLPPEERGSPRDLLYRYEIEALEQDLREPRAGRPLLRALAEAPLSDDPYQAIGRALIAPLDRARFDKRPLEGALEEAELIFADHRALERVEGSTERVDRLLMRAVSRVPLTRYGLVLRARLFSNSGHRDFALVELKHAIIKAPDDPNPYLIRARLLLKYNDLGPAKRDAERARELGARPQELAILRATIAVMEERSDDAEAILNASNQTVFSSELLQLRVSIALLRGRLEEALELLEDSEDRREVSAIEYALYTAALARLGKGEEAAALIASALEFALPRRCLLLLVQASLIINHPDLGLELLELYRERFGLDADLCFLQARCFNRVRRYSDEIKSYDRALTLRPENLQIRMSRGMAYLDLRQIQLALEDFKVAILFEPRSAEAWRWRMFCHYQLGQHREALEVWETLKQLAGPKVLAEYAVYAERSQQALKGLK